MRSAKQAYAEAMKNHSINQMEHNTRMYPIQLAAIESAIETGVTQGCPSILVVTEHQLVPKLKTLLTDLGYIVQWRLLPEDQFEYSIDWAASNQRLC